MLKKIGLLSGSLGVGAIINLAALPFLARFYGPDDFARYGVVIAVVSVLSVISNGRMDQALLVANSGEARSIIGTGLAISLVVSICVYILAELFSSYVEPYYYALACLANSIFQLGYGEMMRRDMLKRCAFLNVMRVSVLVSCQLLAAAIFDSSTLLYGLLVQNIFFIFLGLFFYGTFIFYFSFGVLKNKSDFVFFNAPHALVNALSHNLPYFFVAKYLGPMVAGHYALIDRLMKTPITFFSQVIRQLFIRKVVKLEGKGAALCTKASLLMMIAGAPFFLCIYFVPDKVFTSFLGDEWAGVQLVALYMGVAYLFVFSNPPTSAYIIATRRSHILLKFQIVEISVKIILMFFLLYLYGDERALLAIAVSLFLYNVMMWVYVFKVREDDVEIS